jgi:hypothetical protein
MMIFVETVFPKYAVEAKDLIIDLTQIYKERQGEMAVEDGIQLYKELSEIRRIYLEAFPNRTFPVRLEDLLKEFPSKLIQALDSKVIGWVDAAVQQDDIIHKVPEGQVMGRDRHSSSVVDIFRSFTQSIDSIQKLEWQDDYHYALFMTAMAKILGKGISRYCEVLEKLFTYEMDKATPEQDAARSQTRKERWMAIAREAWSNKDKVEPFQFAPEVCITVFVWSRRLILSCSPVLSSTTSSGRSSNSTNWSISWMPTDSLQSWRNINRHRHLRGGTTTCLQ